MPSDGRSNLFSSDIQKPPSTTVSSVCEAKSNEIEEPAAVSSSASSEACQEKSSNLTVPVTPVAKEVEETVPGSRRSSRNNRKSKNDN